MTRVRAAAALTLALLAAAAPAAAKGPQIAEGEATHFPQKTWILTLPEERRLSTADLQVRENGRPVDRLTVTAGDQAGGDAFGVVLAIDASESMHGRSIQAAMDAARTFASHRRPDQRLGVLFFSRGRTVALAPTADAARIQAALAQTPALTKGTRVYDAGMEAVRLLADAKVRAGSVVILSDGADVGSVTTQAALARAARRAGTRIFTVGLRSPSYDPSTLESLAEAGRGTYAEASSTGRLKGVFGRLGAQLASEYLVTYRSLARASSTVLVEVEVADVAVPAIASYVVPGLHVPPGIPRKPDGAWSTSQAMLGTVGVIGLLLALTFVVLTRGRRRTVSERITAYVQPDEGLPEAFVQPQMGAPSALFERLASRTRWWPRFAEQVELANVPLHPAQLAALTLGGTFGLVWLFAAIGRPIGAGVLALTPVVVHFVLRSRVEKRRALFADQLVENLQVVASAMRAGHSFEGGLAVAGEEAAEPMRGELRRIVNDERLGVPLEEAMDAVAARMQSRELEQVSLVVSIQREAGGNVAELLDRAVETMRHRAELRRMVQSLTAQGRAGGAVVTGMPFVMAFALSLISPGYFDPMIERGAGIVMFIVAALMVGVGWLVIRKIVDIKV